MLNLFVTILPDGIMKADIPSYVKPTHRLTGEWSDYDVVMLHLACLPKAAVEELIKEYPDYEERFVYVAVLHAYPKVKGWWGGVNHDAPFGGARGVTFLAQREDLSPLPSFLQEQAKLKEETDVLYQEIVAAQSDDEEGSSVAFLSNN